MKQVEIYTDGSCLGNPGPGGWAAILIYKGREKCIAGTLHFATNNEMELLAAINALEALKEPCKVTLYSDSQYVVLGMNSWITNWFKNNWRTRQKTDVLNKDLWLRLHKVRCKHDVTFVKVSAHTNNALNNRVDELAREAAESIAKQS